jgi:putative transposase
MAPHTTDQIASANDKDARHEAFLHAITRHKMPTLAAAELYQVAPSTAYRLRNRAQATASTPDDAAPLKMTPRRVRRMRLLPHILDAFHGPKSHGCAGADKVHSILREDPEILKEFGPVGRHLVASIMREHGLRGVQTIKKVVKQQEYAPNIPHGEFRKPGRKVIGADTMQIQCADRKWLYVTLQLDHDDLEIVGAATSEKNDTAMTRKSLREAARTVKEKLDDPTVEIIGHSDRGSPFCSEAYKQELDYQEFIRSNSPVHRPTENPFNENVNSLLRRELPRIVFEQTGKALHELTPQEMAKHVRGYVRFYNSDRPHSSLGYYSPHEFAKLPRDKKEAILARTQARRDRRRKRRHEAIQRARQARLAPVVVALAMGAPQLVSLPLAIAA